MPTPTPLSFRTLLLSAAASGLFGVAAALPALGQTAPSPTAADDASVETKAVQLSPFTVNETQDRGYVAANTIAGSRLNTSLSDTPAAISVFDSAFLSDIGALTTTDALNYMLNGHQDFSDTTGLANSIQQDFQVKVRGVNATTTRDYFDNPNTNSLDGFNTERIDFARGPNSTLYGVGDPGGVINTTTKTALIGRSIDQLQVRVGSFDDSRVTIDENYSAGDKLAFRVNAVDQNRKSWKDFADLDLQAIAGALAYQPFPKTRIDVESEYDDRKSVLAKYFLPQDFMAQWLSAGRPIATNDTTPVAGTALSPSAFLIYDPTAKGAGLMSWKNTLQTFSGAVSPEIGGVIQPITDPSIAPRTVNLGGSGSNVNEWFGFTTATLTQELGPVSLQLAYDHSATDRTEHETVKFAGYGIYGDANPYLPDGTPNPNVGQLYVQDNPRIHRDDYESDDLRATLSYKLDLSAHHLGIHSLTALASRDKTDASADARFLTDLNGTGKLNAAANAIYYRTYLNFGSGSLSQRGAADPIQYPIRNINGTSADFEQTTGATSATTTVLDTAMIADQSSFWNDRIVLTAGVRNDVQALYNGAVGPADPVTGLFPLVTPYQTETVVQGNTRTVGAVFNVLPWLGIFYNNSDDFSPQSTISVNNAPIGPKTGKDQDWGVKFNFPNNLAYLTVTHYQVAQTNASPTDTTLSLSILPEINDIWTALNLPVVPTTQAFDTVDNQGKGWEADLVANLTPNWRLMFNASQNILSEQNVLPRFGAYVAANQALWLKNAATPLVAPFNAITNNKVNPTIADAIAAINSNLTLDRLTSAEVPRGQTEYTSSAFTAYTIDSDNPWLKALTFGGGVNFTGRTVTGYDLTNNYAPVYSGINVLFNGILAKSVRLKRGTLKFQLNVQNIFDNTNLIATVKDNTGTYQYRLQQPRSWSLTTTYSF